MVARGEQLNRGAKTPFWKNPFFWAIALRMALTFAVPRSLVGDSVDYHNIAKNLAEGNGFSRCWGPPFPPTAQRPPLYPIVLAGAYLIGLGKDYGPIILNLLLDIVSMFLARSWARNAGFKWANTAPWVVALCPLLITYGMYPTTENLSVTLFFSALYFLSQEKMALSGLAWGLLALCRSYYLLFPIVLLALNPLKKIPRKAMVIMVAASFAAPGAWMVRNIQTLHRATFSQSSGVGWQSYQGLCVANFDWWRTDHVSIILNDPLFVKMTRTHCSPEDEIAEMDKQAVAKVQQCVTDHPVRTLRNIVIKGVNLFINWGPFMPYDLVPFSIQQLINGVIAFLWFCAFRILRRRKWNGELGAYTRIALMNLGYVALVTIPFAVDARYLLAPELMLVICLIELVKGPKQIFKAAL